MVIEETNLTKGQIRKLNALRNSVGDTLGEDVFKKWVAQEKAKEKEINTDPVAEKILDPLKPLVEDNDINLGRYGYCIRRARGKGAKGFVVSRIEPGD